MVSLKFLQSELEALVIPIAIALSITTLAHHYLRGFSVAGNLLMAAHLNLSLAGLAWGVAILANAEVGWLTFLIISTAFVITVVSLSIGLVQSYEQWEVICRKAWHRKQDPEIRPPRTHYPKVSLHVPAYSEPPELVIDTLNTLAKLDYPNFEVLMIDNNTTDPSLWRPVEQHCKKLGERFRFFHLENLPGAKAGALNFALQNTAEDAELISVVDSDYRVNANFLSELVGYFDDPKMGFIQTPQSYRDWNSDSYLKMCNWEYRLVFSTTLISRNERMAALTVGTMGIIRRRVLDEVGGWAEWCLTEDSELCVRIHALGYRSHYLNKVYGQGLIPENFEGYKKQRFRWTFGPIQELRRHYRLLLPKPFAKASALTAMQKVHHAIHGLGAIKSGLEFLLLPLGALAVASMLIHEESIHIPSHIWIALAVSGVSALVLKWHLFRASMGCSIKETIGALMATTSLDYIIRVASLRGLFTENSPWRRTNKFKVLPLGIGTLSAALPELILGTSMLTVASLMLVFASDSSLVHLVAVGWILQSLLFFSAPLLTLLAEKGIKRRSLAEEAEEQLALVSEPHNPIMKTD
ncbi:glycosyltransferase [Thiomicrorhabdus xiamenensis]|uniref:Beta-monoglucosyldiacylglycerol synthase n=1 Tax=Thiomicrorhabdus xiamenensis TaxID=2739063 RepID=A0A7D4P3Y8_9GAMM|nr:glycosyltransferase [Thiomicrorhabdus xiamenensis]QKI88896.1 glycosyltransferase [Thiomicrorhabdus xiamenensis]